MTAIRSSPPVERPTPAEVATIPPVSVDAVRIVLAGLDRQQRRAVTHGEGPLLVLAGPGTGKTEVLARRVAWLTTTRRTRSSEILALTFTERAAAEMQARVDLLLPYGQSDAAIHTFHAFGDRILRDHGHTIGMPADARVVGRAEALVLLRDRIIELDLQRLRPTGDPTRISAALIDLFARAKEEGLRPDHLAAYAVELEAGARAAADAEGVAAEAVSGLLDEAAEQAEVARAYRAYQDMLTGRSLIDHGDQVSEAVRLLTERPAVRLLLRRRFRYVVVDEAQDANPQQLRLVHLLVGEAGNVTFVGDDDQAIYAFRGAVGDGLASLADSYPSIRDVVLRRNHRSRRPILEVARRLIRHNDPDRLEVLRGVDKTLTAVRRARRPALVSHRAYATSEDEADAVAADVEARLRRGQPARSLAVLVRTNRDAMPILASLDVRGIPRTFSGAAGLVASPEVREALSFMRVVASPSASDDLYAVMASELHGLGGEDLTAICDLAGRRRRSLWSVATELLEQPGLLRLSADSRERLARCIAQLRLAMAAAHERSAAAVLYDHLRDSGRLKELVTRAERGDDGPLRRIARFFELVRSQADLLSDARLAVLMPNLQALLDAGHDAAPPDVDDPTDAVAVLTVHQAKGLEFDTVFVVGLAEGRFPVTARREALVLPPPLTGRRAADDPVSHRAEERRLLYVAMTRARDELLLSHAASIRRGGQPLRPSRFLLEALGQAVAAPPLVAPAVDRAPDVVPAPVPRVGEGTARTPAQLGLSFTQIEDYLTCPRRYHLRHVIKAPIAAHHALVFGNALHQAVAAANLGRMRGEPIEEAAMSATLSAHWRSEGFLSAEHESARFAAGQRALRRFAERSREDASERIVAVERPFSVRIGPVRVRGRYDAVREVDGGIVITDYKSGDVRDPVRARERAREALQLHLYALAWQEEHGKRPDAVELHFLEGDTVGRVIPTDRQLDRARSKVALVAAGLREGAFEATPGFPACDWCPYRRVCPAAA
jgi:DNA helicase-2/ATP-dependent DNA helicase PcrA